MGVTRLHGPLGRGERGDGRGPRAHLAALPEDAQDPLALWSWST